jgi:hypothetical protein
MAGFRSEMGIGEVGDPRLSVPTGTEAGATIPDPAPGQPRGAAPTSWL